MIPENRIKELDFARGFCVLAMIAIHFLYDLTELYFLFPVPPLYSAIKNHGGIVFFLISGISATLGRRSFKRGCTVLLCAALVSAVTSLTGSPVRFGVLSCLGFSMVLWTVFRTLPTSALLFFAGLSLLTGAIFQKTVVSFPFLYPLGLCRSTFQSADYFPLFPYVGWFLLGAVAGRCLYPHRRSLFPRIAFSSPLSRFFRFCGVHALPLYLLHQPVLLAILEAAFFLGEKFYES